MDIGATLLYLAPGALALLYGLGHERRANRVALLVCVAVVVACAVVSHVIYAVGSRDLLIIPTTVGMLSVPAVLGLIGPAIFSDWRLSTPISVLLFGLFVLTVVPVIYAACILFAACI